MRPKSSGVPKLSLIPALTHTRAGASSSKGRSSQAIAVMSISHIGIKGVLTTHGSRPALPVGEPLKAKPMMEGNLSNPQMMHTITQC